MKMTSVLLYEDNRQLRESIGQMLTYSDDYVLLGSFANALDAEAQVRELNPSVILMDIEMPGGVNGIEATRRIRAFDQETPIIMLTVFDDNENVLDAVFAGATGYLLKKHLAERLFDAIEDVLTGGAPMSPNVARMVITSMHKYARTQEDLFELTTREKEILMALAQGAGYKQIAAKYFISIDTVRTHIKNIYQKMQVHSQLEAVAKGREAGIL